MTNNDDSNNSSTSGLRTNRGKQSAETVLENDQTNESFHQEPSTDSGPQMNSGNDWDQHNHNSETYDHNQNEYMGNNDQTWEDENNFSQSHDHNQHENMGNHEQTWEDVESLHEYVPGFVRQYAHDNRNNLACKNFFKNSKIQ